MLRNIWVKVICPKRPLVCIDPARSEGRQVVNEQGDVLSRRTFGSAIYSKQMRCTAVGRPLSENNRRVRLP
ncbi:hypothetical protein D3C85_1701820 [compost metagenome]